jgi:hypothetical protein
MSEQSESTALVNYEEMLRQELSALPKQIEPPSSNKISTKGKLFTLPGGRSSPGPMQCIVLDWVAINMVYAGVYNPNVRQPPLCWAIGKNLDELRPSDAVKTPQNTDCATCPKNQWGSGAGGKGKACKNQRRLLVVAPDFSEGDEPMSLYVSPTGLKSWNAYVKRLASEHGKLPVQVITEIAFDPQQSYPTLVFSYKEPHSRLNEAMKLRTTYQDMLYREPDQQAA